MRAACGHKGNPHTCTTGRAKLTTGADGPATVFQALVDAAQTLCGSAGGSADAVRIRLVVTEWCEGGTLRNHLIRMQALAQRGWRPTPVGYLPPLPTSSSNTHLAHPPTPSHNPASSALGSAATHHPYGCVPSFDPGPTSCSDICATGTGNGYHPPPPPSRAMSVLHDGGGCGGGGAAWPYGAPLHLTCGKVFSAPLPGAANRQAAQMAALQAALDIARGVAALHAAGVVHGALSPSTIMCTYVGATFPLGGSGGITSGFATRPASGLVDAACGQPQAGLAFLPHPGALPGLTRHGHEAEVDSRILDEAQLGRSVPLPCLPSSLLQSHHVQHKAAARPLEPRPAPPGCSSATAPSPAPASATVSATNAFDATVAAGSQTGFVTSLALPGGSFCPAPDDPSSLHRSTSAAASSIACLCGTATSTTHTGAPDTSHKNLTPLQVLRKLPWALRPFRSASTVPRFVSGGGAAIDTAAATSGGHSHTSAEVDAVSPMAAATSAVTPASGTTVCGTLNGTFITANTSISTTTATTTTTCNMRLVAAANHSGPSGGGCRSPLHPAATATHVLDGLAMGAASAVQATCTVSALSSACGVDDSKTDSQTVAHAAACAGHADAGAAGPAGRRILSQLPSVVPVYTAAPRAPSPTNTVTADMRSQSLAGGAMSPYSGPHSHLPIAAAHAMVFKVMMPSPPPAGPPPAGQDASEQGGGSACGGVVVSQSIDLSLNTTKWRTLAYAAPELFAGLADSSGISREGSGSGRAVAGPEADVFSLGALLWQLCSGGRPPHYDRHPAQILMGLLTGDLDLELGWPEDVDPEVAELGRACLLCTPADRPTSAQVVEGLEAALVRLRAASARETGRATLR